jgi:hypothetical protein
MSDGNFQKALTAVDEIFELTMKASHDSYAVVAGRLMGILPYIIVEEDADRRLEMLTKRVAQLKKVRTYED